MDKEDKGNPINQWKVDMCQVRGPKLDSSLLPNGLGRKMRERKGESEKERDFRERDSNFSLNFPAIGPSNPGEPRSKVAPHGKSYTWTLVLWSLEKLRNVGVFSYLDIPC